MRLQMRQMEKTPNPLEQMEQVQGQVVYVFPTENLNAHRDIPSLRNPGEFFVADQDKNENENRFCA